MAARKLQTEIDRTLKKVAEGVELFEGIYEKMQASTNQTQKEKQEMDLKTQIKKLQRQRDQIKAWAQSNDIKDKTLLFENRRLIETQMEKFKACEKEMKTKAFSKEGLIQAARLDPKEQEKEDAMQWLQQQVEDLQMQVESTEAEVESLQNTGKKKNKGASAQGRLEELEHLNDRRKWHIGRLEIVLRLLNNGSLTAERVNALKEDVQYFVANNNDDNFEEDDGIYEELNLDEAEGEFGLVADDGETSDSDEESEDSVPPPKSKKQQQQEEESGSSSKRHESPILKKAGVSLAMRKHSVDTAKPPPNLNFSQPMSSVVKSGLPTPAPRSAAPTLPPIRYAAAAAAAVTSQPPTSASSHPPSTAPLTPSLAPASATSHVPPSTPSALSSAAAALLDQYAVPSPSLTQASVVSPVLSSAASASQPPEGSSSAQQSPALSEVISISGSRQAPTSPQSTVPPRKESVSVASPQIHKQPVAVQIPTEEPTQQFSTAVSFSQHTPAPTSQPSPLPQQLTTPSLSPGAKVAEQQQAVPAAPQATQQAIGQRPPSTTQSAAPARPNAAFPGSLSDLVVSFENVKQKALRMGNLDQVHKMLEGGLINIPQPQDTDKPKYYVPRNPFNTAPYYPQNPHPTLGTPALFSQLDVETLFYIFYYLPGTYQQYLAAKELKRQSWRFHVKYLTWFQRHSEPQAITEEYEQGVYVYFDWEGSWCQRKKSDFRFEYRYLSED